MRIILLIFLPLRILRHEKLTQFGRLFFSFFSGTHKFRMLLCIPSSPAQIYHLFHNSGYSQGIVLFHMGSVIPLSSNPALFFFFNIKPRELIIHLCVIIDSIKPYGLVRLSNILNSTFFLFFFCFT